MGSTENGFNLLLYITADVILPQTELFDSVVAFESIGQRFNSFITNSISFQPYHAKAFVYHESSGQTMSSFVANIVFYVNSQPEVIH